MALGDSYNNNNQNKSYDNTYYSRLKVKNNKDGHILGYAFRSGMLIVSISAKNSNEYETLAEIYITPTKAAILAKQIELLKEDLNNAETATTKGYGIITGLDETVSTLILRTVDTEVGVMPALTIGKIDGSGNFVKRVDFDFNTNYDFGINWKNVDGMEYENNYYNDIEFEQFCRLITDFANSSNGAYAYAMADITRYDTRALSNKLNPIYDKLGIERPTGGNKNRTYSGNNFFRSNGSSSGNTTSTNKSYDQLMTDITDDEEEVPFSED